MSSTATTQACSAVDPADVDVSTTTKDGGGITATSTTASTVAESQHGPSTSSGVGFRRQPLDGPGSSSTTASEAAALRRPRKSLPFIPRTTQYERHPLLQMRSTATGLSEFELLMLERDAADERPRRMSVETSSMAPSSGGVGGSRPPLVPRTAQRETHPLFVRSADSGVSELEEYLSEISQMTPPARKSSKAGAAASVHSRTSVSSQQPAPASTSSAAGADGNRTTAASPTPAPPAPRKLEPRISQCERHALLEIKDESGLSELERLLMEKNDEAAAAAAAAAAAGGGDGRRCPVCGAEPPMRCDCSRRTCGRGVNAADCFLSSDSVTSAQQKRVRFMQQRQKTESEDVAAATATAAAAQVATAADSAAVPSPTSKANSVDSSSKKSSKSRSSKGRGGAVVRADSTPTGVGTGAAATHRKSCCVS